MGNFSIGRTFSRAFALAGATWRTVGLFLLLVTIASTIVQLLTQRFLVQTMTMSQTNPDPTAALAIFTSGWYWGVMLFSLALGSFSFAGALHGMLEAGQDRSPTLGECIVAAAAKFVPVLALTILWGLGVGLGWLLLVVPGLILMCMWSVSLPALVGEDIGVIASFGRSRALTKGSRWMIFVTLLVYLVVAYVVLFGIIGAAVGGSMFSLATAQTAAPWLYLISIPIGWLNSMALNALLASIYLETITIREGGTHGQLNEVFS